MKLANIRVIISILILGTSLVYLIANFNKIRNSGSRLLIFAKTKNYNQIHVITEIFDKEKDLRVFRKLFVNPLFFDKDLKLVFWTLVKSVNLDNYNEKDYEFRVNRKRAELEKCNLSNREIYCLKGSFYTVYLPRNSNEERVCLTSFSK